MRTSLGLLPLGIIVTAAAACGGGAGAPAEGRATPVAPAPNATSAAAPTAERDMIVIMQDQMPGLRPGRDTRRARAIAAAHAPILAELQAAKARRARSFELVNAFATRLSQAEIDRLSARPEVRAVVPDRLIKNPFSPHRSGASRAHDRASPVAAANGLCNTLEPEALQLTNTAFLDPSVPQAQEVVDGNGAKVTGSGVKVAILADGLDTTVAGFTRPDGSQVFVDYQDFSGDPAGTPTGGGEMFGDASSIAAQDMPNGQALDFDISTFVSTSYPLPSPCNVRIRGMAPGASLVGLKVIAEAGYATESSMVQAVEYAVVHGGVDVINESLGGVAFPDDSTDPFSLANKAAVEAGVTVVACTGDSGTNSTMWTPSTDPWVIAAGATTQYRLYAQTHEGMYPLADGYVSGNIAPFSGGGFAQKRARTVDLVAPGDSGWALCSSNTGLYFECYADNGNPSAIEVFGGTSEATPLISGAAALVIQAYRSTHHGASPSPALVKSILMSSAQDLGAPSDEQGAGFLDGLKAVSTALSVSDENGAPPSRGDGLLVSPSAVSVTASAGDAVQRQFQITNTGASTLDVEPALEALGAPFAGGTFTLDFDPATAPAFMSAYGVAFPYVEQTFTVPAGADHLDAAIAWEGLLGGTPQGGALTLLDPQGRQVAYSSPQGLGSGYGHVDVVNPAPGTWTAAIVTSPAGQIPAYTGPVELSWAVERFAGVGQVFPQHLSLPPGATAQVFANLDVPGQPGDFAAALRLHGAGGAALSEVPVTVRALIPIGPQGGTFTGTLTGGNGRPAGAPTTTYAFDVPAGVPDLSLSLQIPDPGYRLAGYLVDPHGMILASSGNIDPTGAQQTALQLYRDHPEAGRWRFVLVEVQASGNETSVGFNGRIAFTGAQVAAAGLPDDDGTVLSASQPPLTIPLTLTNPGSLAKAFFVDARLRAPAAVTLCSASATGSCLATWVPPRASAVQFVAEASVPLTMDVSAFDGSPDLWAQPLGNGSIAASLSTPEVPFGPWYMTPVPVGPFGPGGAPSVPVTSSTTATMEPFDPAVASTSGDFWSDVVLGTATFDPIVLAPGATGTITVTITPDPTRIGKTVSGYVYVDTFNGTDGYAAGEEIARLPYAYTIGH